MAAIYDAQGNYMGDDGAPDLDQMKLELTKKNIPLSSQIPGYGKPVPPAQTKPDPLGAAAGNFTELATKFNPLMMAKSMQEAVRTLNPVTPVAGAWADVAQNVQTAGAEAMYDILGNRQGIAKMQQNYVPVTTGRFYQEPTTQFGKEFESGVTKAMDASKIPAMWPMAMNQPIRPPITPNDVRVIGAEATRVGRQVRDIPTDFYNAQSGLQKLDPITGQPTMGAKLQGVAESVGDIAAARRAEGKSLIPGIPDVVTPESSLYAVRPQGSRLVRPVVPETANVSRAWDQDVLDNVGTGPLEPHQAWNILSNDALSAGPLRNGFRTFLENKYKEMYPDAPSLTDAKEAFQTLYNDRNSRAAKTLEFYDEFLKTPEALAAGAEHLPTASDVKARHDAATQWLNSNLLNYIQKNVGAEGDPLVKLASEGLTYLPADKYHDALQSAGGKRLVEQNRLLGNMPLEGSLAEPIAKKESALAEAQSKVRELEAKRQNLADIAMRQGLPDPAMLPEYAALTNPVRAAIRERDKLEDQLSNLKTGRSYEAAADYGVVPVRAKDFLSNEIEYAERQFYPTVQKTPPEENVYRTYGAHLDSLGFNKLAEDFYRDVMSGDIPLDKVNKMTVENYVRNTAKARIDEEKAAKEAAKAYKRNAEATLQQRARDAIPNDKTFGNAGVIELTKDTPEADIIRTMSEDTAVLDHCVGQGGSAADGDRNPWYGNSRRSYEPILDLVTGQPNPRANRDRTSYVNQVLGGDKIASIRDLSTGLPQATLHLEQTRLGANGQQKYSIGYASGHQNGDIDAKYAPAIRDYLNSIADQIDSSGHNLESHAGVYDMYDADFGSAMRRALNMGKQQFEKYDLQNLPRFVTLSDVRAAIKAADLSAASPAKTELVELNHAMEDAMQEHADLMRMARRRPMEDADRDYVAELEATINTLRQRINDIEQQAQLPAVAAAPTAPMTYRTPGQAEVNAIISSIDNIGNVQAFDLRNEVNETARTMFMETLSTLARENGIQNVTIDNIPDFGRSLQGLRNDIDAQLYGLRQMGFEGRAVADALEAVKDVIGRHIQNLETGPDEAVAAANTLMADPETPVAQQGETMPAMSADALLLNYSDRLTPEQQQYLREFRQRWENTNYPDALSMEFARWRSDNSLAPAQQPTPQQRVEQIANQRELAQTIRNAAAQSIETLRRGNADLGNLMDTIVTQTMDVYPPSTMPQRFANSIRGAGVTAHYDDLRNALTALADEIDAARQQLEQQPAPRNRFPILNPDDFDPETFISNYIEDARQTMDNETITRIQSVVDDIGQYLNMRDNTAEFVERLRAAGDEQQSEVAELALYDIAEQIETRMLEQLQDLATARQQEITDMLNNPDLDPEQLRSVAFDLLMRANDLPLPHWLPLAESDRRAFAQQLRQRANYMEFSPRDFAVRLANEAGLDFNELRDTILALNDGVFDHEVLRGLPDAEQGRAAQATAIELQRNMGQPTAARLPLDEFYALTRRVMADFADDPVRMRNLIADLRRGNPHFQTIINLPPDQHATVAAELADALERGMLNPNGIPPEPEGNANGGTVRGYQKGGSVKKPEVATPWLFSVPTYSETVAYEMYPGQKGQDDQRDAARHMLAAGTLSRKYGPGVAEFLGKAHEFTTSPLQAIKSVFGGKMPADYGMDTHNNTIGAQLGQRAKSQAELEDLVQEAAERASRTQTSDKAFIKKANGGIVQQNPTTDQMRYALMMRRK